MSIGRSLSAALVAALISSAGFAETKRTATTDYIVVLRAPAVAAYDGGDSRFEAIPRRADKGGRLDVQSRQALVYADHLKQSQGLFLERVGSRFGRTLEASMQMQHALNALVIRLSADEAAALAADGEVLLVEARRDEVLNTDAGPNFIGAPQLWMGTPGASTEVSIFANGVEGGFGTPNRGEGVVVGIIDSGANMASPAFADPSPDGYDHINPLGGTTRLGWCNGGTGTVTENCNDKIIGAWDFVDTQPASPQCLAGTYRETLGVGDENGHGSHTASTSAGNPWTTPVPGANGVEARISGVAPRASLVIYDACYSCSTSNGPTGLCPNTSTAASVNQAVADGVVDVINYSIGGGSNPWTDTVSLAMLAAQNAGILVSASAGNSGPAANTLGHREPWTMTVAASTHDRAIYTARASVQSPTPPTILQDIGAVYATGSPTTPLNAAIKYAEVSPLGCGATSPFPAGYFNGTIALIDRGSCNFSEKFANAISAGAIGLLVANNSGGAPVVMPSNPNTHPSAMITLPAGIALRDFVLANPGNSGGLAALTPPVRTLDPAIGDIMASFSSRGPNSAGTTFLDSIKPDVSAPGVSILAVHSTDGGPNSVAFLQGTSMASPHAAGSAALIKGARPDWTPMEIKSALAMTAKTSMLKENGTTPSDPFDRGAGRVQPFNAAKAGLVLNETQANFQAANPAGGGDPSTLNLASLGNDACSPSCSFTRTFRSTEAAAVTWNLSIAGVTGTASPSSFTIPAGGTQAVTFTVQSTGLTTTFSFGEVVLTPTSGNSPTLRIPIAVRLP